MSNSYHGHLDTGHVSQRSRDPGTCLMSQSMISADLTTDNRQSIEHSLALIRHHVKVITCHKQRKIFSKQKYLSWLPSQENIWPVRNKNISQVATLFQGLNDVQIYGGVPPPPPSDTGNTCPPPVCPPPPGFSDSDSMSEDNDSLTSDPGSFNRFGFSRVSRQHSLAGHDKWRQDRMMPQVGTSNNIRNWSINQPKRLQIKESLCQMVH